jgi:hypothetical protein
VGPYQEGLPVRRSLNTRVGCPTKKKSKEKSHYQRKKCKNRRKLQTCNLEELDALSSKGSFDPEETHMIFEGFGPRFFSTEVCLMIFCTENS